MKQKKFDDVQKLLIELSSLQSEYYNNRTLLGFAYPEELSQTEKEQLEIKMPILEKRINQIKDELDNITIV